MKVEGQLAREISLLGPLGELRRSERLRSEKRDFDVKRCGVVASDAVLCPSRLLGEVEDEGQCWESWRGWINEPGTRMDEWTDTIERAALGPIVEI